MAEEGEDDVPDWKKRPCETAGQKASLLRAPKTKAAGKLGNSSKAPALEPPSRAAASRLGNSSKVPAVEPPPRSVVDVPVRRVSAAEVPKRPPLPGPRVDAPNGVLPHGGVHAAPPLPLPVRPRQNVVLQEQAGQQAQGHCVSMLEDDTDVANETFTGTMGRGSRERSRSRENGYGAADVSVNRTPQAVPWKKVGATSLHFRHDSLGAARAKGSGFAIASAPPKAIFNAAITVPPKADVSAASRPKAHLARRTATKSAPPVDSIRASRPKAPAFATSHAMPHEAVSATASTRSERAADPVAAQIMNLLAGVKNQGSPQCLPEFSSQDAPVPELPPVQEHADAMPESFDTMSSELVAWRPPSESRDASLELAQALQARLDELRTSDPWAAQRAKTTCLVQEGPMIIPVSL